MNSNSNPTDENTAIFIMEYHHEGAGMVRVIDLAFDWASTDPDNNEDEFLEQLDLHSVEMTNDEFRKYVESNNITLQDRNLDGFLQLSERQRIHFRLNYDI